MNSNWLKNWRKNPNPFGFTSISHNTTVVTPTTSTSTPTFTDPAFTKETLVYLPLRDDKKSDSKDYAKLQNEGVQFGRHYDDVLIEAIVPKGWRLVQDKSDKNRKELYNADEKLVARMYCSKNDISYFGYLYTV